MIVQDFGDGDLEHGPSARVRDRVGLVDDDAADFGKPAPGSQGRDAAVELFRGEDCDVLSEEGGRGASRGGGVEGRAAAADAD